MWSWVKYGQDYWLVMEPRLAPKYLRKIHGIKYSSPPPPAIFFFEAIVKKIAGIGILANLVVSSKKIEEEYNRYRLCIWCWYCTVFVGLL